MKEYLFKYNDQYTLVELSKEDAESNPEQYIEVPDGAEVATASGLAIYFWKPSENKTFIDNVGWSECDTKSICTLDSYLEDADVSIIWEREQDEPFLTPETTLNDQYAEIEQVRQQTIEATLAERQAQYGSFEDVARITGKIMEALSGVRVNGLSDLPYPHRMALYMIASKMARIMNGDFNYRDNWHDIGGYSKLIEDLL